MGNILGALLSKASETSTQPSTQTPPTTFPENQSLLEYLTFIGCVDTTKAEEVASILETNGFDS